ncbi:hypothetical protein OW763_03010 [Clostridium aestuarii]|uniref:Lipoprotein n=1 Tax=Clostridium aestuarii TaxID=338193 RepID=A0ABT4CWE3_9CLOT|nr:hypothetical protein [Clostridium aestuarii]MCY6483326.1 hypothetical protein [Clostridium aestuarii]
MKKFKSFIGLFLMSIMVFALSGCGAKSDKEIIINAIEKSNSINTCAYKAKIDIKADGIKKDTPSAAMDKVNIEFDGKSIKEKDEQSKFQGNLKLNASGMNVAMKMMGEASVKNDKANFQIFMQIPEIIKSQAAPMFENIDYVYVSSDTLEKFENQLKAMGQAPAESGINPLSINGLDKQKELLKSLKDYINKNGDKIIENKGKQEVEINNNKENIEIYDVKIDNAEIKKILQDIMVSEDKSSDSKELDKSIDEILKAIGEEGLKVTIGIKDGYIVYEKINMNSTAEDVKVQCSIILNIFDINKKIEINIPKKEDVKSIDLMELMGMLLGAGIQ